MSQKSGQKTGKLVVAVKPEYRVVKQAHQIANPLDEMFSQEPGCILALGFVLFFVVIGLIVAL